jgi:hypothetical protein
MDLNLPIRMESQWTFIQENQPPTNDFLERFGVNTFVPRFLEHLIPRVNYSFTNQELVHAIHFMDIDLLLTRFGLTNIFTYEDREYESIMNFSNWSSFMTELDNEFYINENMIHLLNLRELLGRLI